MKKTAIGEYLAKIGRRGGLKGGKARMEALTAEQRMALARKAATARWLKKESRGGGK